MDRKEINRERVNGIVMQHPNGITVAALCGRLVELGWAEDDVTPAALGLDDDAIVRVKR